MIVLSFALVAQLQLVQASGNLTTSTSNQGQVRTASNGGALYLTSELQDGANSDTALINQYDISVSAPRGFANTFGGWLSSVFRLILLVSALLVLLYLILGAFQWLTSGGEKGKIDQARDKMFAAIIGILIVAASYAIFNLVLYLLGFASLDDLFQSIIRINGAQALPFSQTLTATRSATFGN